MLHAAGAGAARRAAGHALNAIGALHGVRRVSGYLPIRSEIDPLPAMLALHGLGFTVCVPVIAARDRPLSFRTWTPGCALVRGKFGVEVPERGQVVEPEVLLVPLLAFDDRGCRLGYGGGFFDRTLAGLRALGRVQAFGFAYAGQQVARAPICATDAPLDGVVTETGLRRFA